MQREWQRIQSEAAPIREKYDAALETSNRRQQTTYAKQLEQLRETMLKQLREITVLDPACGSGNFLYVALQRLMDMEKVVIKSPLFSGLTEAMPEVHPRQMYGIEINPIAHALASIVVWIGYLAMATQQWLHCLQRANSGRFTGQYCLQRCDFGIFPIP
ncbi:MAG: N-6 DNA methylase [Anaerolineae bacterium]|nr:N-6 DNA methylase [Anaerolineae bacterium]